MSAHNTASAHTHAGTAPPGYHHEWVTRTVHWHGFESLSAERDEYVDSPEFMLAGNEWCLKICPGGDNHASEGMATLVLWNMSDKAIDIEYGFSVNDGSGKQVVLKRSTGPFNFAPVGTGLSGWGFTNFAKRSDLLCSLVNGALVIEVHMKLATPTKSVSPPFIPENPSSCKTIQGVFMDEKYSDIVFEVGGEEDEDNAMKVAKISRETFPAHRVIVANSSTILSDLCESHDDSTTPIQINDVTPDIFRLLLRYIYGGKVSENDMVLHARGVIDAADKYGVVNLKLEAEANLVEGTIFTIANVMELLLYAESKNCALLKEASMDYILENKSEVIKKLSFNDAPGTLLNDMLTAFVRRETEYGAPAGGNDDENVDSQYDSLRISELRKRAYEKGLNVDESREMLIAALKTVQDLESEVDSEVDGSNESEVDSEED